MSESGETGRDRSPSRLRSCLLYFCLPVVLVALAVAGYVLNMHRVAGQREDIVRSDLAELATAIHAYQRSNGRYPATLGALVPTQIAKLPVDPWTTDGGSYRYLNINNSYIVRIYSVGADGLDQLSMGETYEQIEPPPEVNAIDVYESLQIEWGRDDPSNGIVPIMRALIAFNVSDSTGYAGMAKAGLVVDRSWEETRALLASGSGKAELQAGRSTGWEMLQDTGATYSVSGLSEIQYVIETNKLALDLVRLGVARPVLEATWPEQYYRPGSYIPNFMDFQDIARLLIAEGKELESRNFHDAALDDYLIAARLSQASAQKGTFLIGKRISMALDLMAQKAIQSLLLEHSLDEERLASLIERLQQLRADAPTMRNAYENERLCRDNSWKAITWANPGEEGSMIGGPTTLMGTLSYHTGMFLRQGAMILTRATLLEDSERMYSHFSALSETSYTAVYNEDAAVFETSLSIFSRPYVSFEWSTLKWEFLRRTSANATIVMAALERYRLTHGTFPENLADVTMPDGGPLPLDAFTERPYIYRKAADGYSLWSPGPDLYDDGGAIPYDPTNGIQSTGDLLFGPSGGVGH